MSATSELTVSSRLNPVVWKVLLKRIEEGNCTPILGPDMCVGSTQWRQELAHQWAGEYNFPLDEDRDFASVAQFVAFETDLNFPKIELQKQLQLVPLPDFSDPNEPHRILAELPLPVYVTTNCVDFMFQALKRRSIKEPKLDWCGSYDTSGSGNDARPSIYARDEEPLPNVANPLVYHLFGHINEPSSMTLTEDDYLDFLVRMSQTPSPIPPPVQAAFGPHSTVLFLGFRPNDFLFRVMLRSLIPVLRRKKHVSIQIVTFADGKFAAQRDQARKYLEGQYQKLKQLDINVYWGECREFLVELKQRWEEGRRGN